jgi:hypothetical protein
MQKHMKTHIIIEVKQPGRESAEESTSVHLSDITRRQLETFKGYSEEVLTFNTQDDGCGRE